jgi:hypothetical protein
MIDTPTSTVGPDCSDDVHNIVGAALFALGTGARGARIDLSAIESFRARFKEQIQAALEDADWPSNWRQEEGYLIAYVSAVGARAARFAAEERRSFITTQDLDLAMLKLRGHLPIAGRWCPV